MLKFQSETNLGLLAIQEPRHYIESNDKIPKQQTQGCRLVTLSTQSKGWFIIQGCELRSPLETLVSNGDFFGKNLENWSPNGLLLRQKSPYPLKFLAFHKKINKI